MLLLTMMGNTNPWLFQYHMYNININQLQHKQDDERHFGDDFKYSDENWNKWELVVWRVIALYQYI